MITKSRRITTATLAITLIISLLFANFSMANAESVVSDPVLKKIIQLKLHLDENADVTASDVGKITSLAYSGYAASLSGKINSLNGLQYATSMTLLDITDCNVTSLTPIANLSALTTLVLRNNPVDLRTGSVDYYIVMALKARGCNVVYNTPKPSPYLVGLKVSIGALSPAFTAGLFSFKLTLPDTYAGHKVTITPTKADSAAKMLINGHAVKSYTVYIGINSSKAVTVKVTAKDKSATKTYIITIDRPSSNNRLSSIRISAGYLYPRFNKNIMSYGLMLKSTQSKATITPVKSDKHAKILIDGVSVSSKTVSVASGATAIVKITVIAANGALRDYCVTVCRPQ